MHEHDGRIGTTQHDDLVERWNIHTLVEDIDREDVFDLAPLQTGNLLVSLFIGRCAAHRNRAVARFVELLREHRRLLIPIAEDKSAALGLLDRIFLYLRNDMLHTFVRSEFREQGHVVDGFVVDFQVGDAEVMERRQHVFLKGVLQGDSESDHVIEQAVYVITIGARRSCRHPQEERRLEMRKDRPIAVRTGTMRLVDDDVVEFPWIEVVQMLAQSAHHGENTAFRRLGRTATVDAIGIPGA